MTSGRELVLQIDELRFRRAPERAGAAGFELVVDEMQLHRGQVVGIVGPSGCGKSTLVDLLAMLRRPASVRRFDILGTDVVALQRSRSMERCASLRAACIGVVLQTGGLLPSLSVIENVMLPQRLLGRVDTAHARDLLEALGLADLAARLPSQISIGQRQRVAIARALSHRPPLVLADEPTASLGQDHAPAAMDLLLGLCESQAAALLIVSHDVELLQRKRVPMRQCAIDRATVYLEPA